MVGYDPKKEAVPLYVNSAAGAISGVFTRAVGQPLDVLKIRFQLQIEPKAGSKEHIQYRSILQACSRIHREEGLRAFWKGHVPAQALSVVYGVVQFATFEFLTKHMSEWLPETFSHQLRPFTHFLCGSISGCGATLASMPFDVIRTRFIAQGEPKIYRSLYHAASCMYIQEGPRAFFKGLTPTLVQIAPQTGLQFGFYTFFKSLWELFFCNNTQNSTGKTGGWESLCCGSAAGLCAKVLVYPLDLTKKRLQVHGFEEAISQRGGHVRRYSGLIDCFLTIVKEEGGRGLFRGLSPSVVKAVVTTAVTFWGYEQSLKMLTSIHRSYS